MRLKSDSSPPVGKLLRPCRRLLELPLSVGHELQGSSKSGGRPPRREMTEKLVLGRKAPERRRRIFGFVGWAHESSLSATRRRFGWSDLQPARPTVTPLSGSKSNQNGGSWETGAPSSTRPLLIRQADAVVWQPISYRATRKRMFVHIGCKGDGRLGYLLVKRICSRGSYPTGTG